MMISLGKYRVILILSGFIMSMTGYANEPMPVEPIDSTVMKQDSSVKSLIDTTNTFIPDGMETNVDLMPHQSPEPPVQNEDTAEQEESFLIYNRLNMPLEYERPYPTDVWRIPQYLYKYEKEKKWLDVSVEKNPELEEYFQLDTLRLEILHHIMFYNPNLITGIRNNHPIEYKDDEVPTIETSTLLEHLTHSNLDISTLKPSNKMGIDLGQKGYWAYANKSSLQFSQNYISENWQQGGESNLALNGTLNMKANYAHVSGLTLNNELDWRASFFTAPSDTVRSWRVTDDQLRLTSNLAFKAFQKWNYSTTAEFKTRFFNSFKTNSNTKLASFLSPAEFSFSIGLSYANDLKKLKIKDLNLAISPLSYNWKYVRESKRIDVTRYGITAGKHALDQVGSRLDLKFTQDIKKNICWNTRYYYFTTYKSVESEWENTLNFTVNRYFSTKIFFDLRFDDKRKLKSNEDSYFQFKELLSFGFSYVW
jgi:Protein of unknown function (DUF3078).